MENNFKKDTYVGENRKLKQERIITTKIKRHVKNRKNSIEFFKKRLTTGKKNGKQFKIINTEIKIRN